MSLPDEELRALRSTWEFLLEIGNSYGGYKRVPLHVRMYARQLSKHFPLGGEIRNLADRTIGLEDSLVSMAEDLEIASGIKGTAAEALRESNCLHLVKRLKL